MAVFKLDQLRPSAATATALRDKIARIATRNSRKPLDPRIIRIVEVALVAAIGLLLASTFWALVGPIPQPSATPRPSAPPPTQVASGPIDPFRTASGAATPAAAEDFNSSADLAETTLNLVLHGTWLTPEGGAAFIKTPDEKQGRYGIGDTISSGVTLDKVYRDQVVINRGGVRESLRLINREQLAPPLSERNEAIVSNEIANNVSGMGTIGEVISAKPVMDGVGNMRLILQPAGDPESFAEMGLRPGDALVAIDNQPLTADAARNMELLATTVGKQAVSISIERDGVIMPITVPMEAAANAGDEDEE